MDDPRWEPGMPVLDRQPVGPGSAAPTAGALPPRSVPETAPTPLQKHYVNLSAVGLVCGAIAITALELGTPPSSLLVKVPVLVGAPFLAITTADATLRIWRSAWAWMPVDRGRALFRLTWVAAAAVFLALIVVAAVLVLLA
jgi:hypothetical protein